MPTYAELVALGRAERRELVHVERGPDRAVVTLDEPDRLNPLSIALTLQLQDALTGLAADPRIRAVVLTGADPAFCAGGDLDLIATSSAQIRDADADMETPDAWHWIRRHFGGIVRLMVTAETAFVAAVNGPAAGVGLSFALACDVILASERAVLVPAFGRLGLVPEVGTSWLLTRRLGYHGAFAFWATGAHVDAAEAARLGLVQQVHPHGELLAAADRWCDTLVTLPPHALRMTKPLLRAAADASWEQALGMEEFAEANCFSTRTLGEAAGRMR